VTREVHVLLRRRVWIVIAAVIVVIATVLVVLNQLRVAAAREARRVRAERNADVRTRLFAEIQPVNIANCQLKRFGEPHDGGYPLCVNLLADVKSGYSYGISGYDGWGCEVSRLLQVPVHQYDCFDMRRPSCPGGRTMFHAECVGTKKSVEDGRPFDSIGSQFGRNGDAGTRVVMKIDVEGAEWDAFLAAPDEVLRQIDQLDVEFHHVEDPKYVATLQRLKRFFYVAHVHYNNFSCQPSLRPFPSWAFEVLLVNKRIAVTDGKPAPPAPAGIDAANNELTADCQTTRSSPAGSSTE
jgi:hypothetical protein